MAKQSNVYDKPIKTCSENPRTGFFRDGCCNTDASDVGSHTVCIIATAAFLEFSKSRGNDLSTPRPEWDFPGVKPGDRWCLCASRWLEAEKAGCAPMVDLDATNESCLDIIDLRVLERYSTRNIN